MKQFFVVLSTNKYVCSVNVTLAVIVSKRTVFGHHRGELKDTCMHFVTLQVLLLKVIVLRTLPLVPYFQWEFYY